MTTQEFSNEFDILYNNISSNAAPGLNEYEKSVLLTKAQLEIVRNYFNPKGNRYQEGYDGSQKRQIDFSRLTKIAKPIQIDNDLTYVKFDDRSQLFKMPDDVLYVLNETATVTYDNKYKHKVNIVPITYDEYTIFVSRPYKQPYKQQGWRLINSTNESIAELIVKEDSQIEGYAMRYVRKPQPIILIDLSAEKDIDGENFIDLTIQGRNERTECELDESIHQEILQRAVELAKNAYLGDLQSTLQLGTRTE